MNKILDIITKNLENGNYLLIIVILILVILFKFETIFKSFDNLKKNKIKYLFELEKKDILDENIREALNETINNQIFKITTGINTNKFMRQKILELYHQKKGELTLRQFKLSQNFLNLKNEEITINLTKFDTFWFIINLFIGFFMFFIGLVMIIIPINTNISALQILTFIIMGVGFIIISVQPLKDALSYKTAMKIKKIIDI